MPSDPRAIELRIPSPKKVFTKGSKEPLAKGSKQAFTKTIQFLTKDPRRASQGIQGLGQGSKNAFTKGSKALAKESRKPKSSDQRVKEPRRF